MDSRNERSTESTDQSVGESDDPHQESNVESQTPEEAKRPAKSKTTGNIVRSIYAVFGVVVIGFASFFSIQAASGGDDVRANLTLIAPAAAGGGWDTFVREQQQAMRANQLANNVQAINIPGAGGVIGLGKLSTMEGRANNLMVGGTGMVAAAIQQDSPVTLEDVTPIARVVEEYNVVLVPGDSPYQTLDELMEAWIADPRGVPWTGGGSFDQLVMTELALAAGLDPANTTYIPSDGGGEVAQALINGTAQASAAGYPDMADQIASGRLRALGVAAPERMDGIDIPTLTEQGFDVTLANWRALFAPAGITEEEKAELLELVNESIATPEWQAAIPRYSWTEVYLDGPELDAFVAEERTRITALYEEMGQ